MKYIANAMKFDTQSRLSWLILNMIFENSESSPEIKNLGTDLVSKLQCAPPFMKFGT